MRELLRRASDDHRERHRDQETAVLTRTSSTRVPFSLLLRASSSLILIPHPFTDPRPAASAWEQIEDGACDRRTARFACRVAAV